MYNNDKKQQRVLLIAVDSGEYEVETSLKELEELAQTAGAEVVGTMVQNLPSPNNATYIGAGKLQEVKEFCEQSEIDLVVFDDELSGVQIRNIEDALSIDIIDRTMLILDIFAMRALSNEGKLQVELAQQKYLLPRLIGMGKQLSRQGGAASGSIGSRGPGETKLESDKRHIRRRIEALQSELREMEQRRERTRARRSKNDAVTIAIVGYTNVGKSTLLNLLTDAGVLAKDQLFATLDPTARELKLEDGQAAILIDTVGLIQRLPHQLVQAFKSTLEEAANADVILNICDISDPNVGTQIQVTRDLLQELGCAEIPVITVYNKIDKVSFDIMTNSNQNTVYISAKQNQGVDSLLSCIARVLADKSKKMKLLIPYTDGAVIDRIRKQGKVLSEEYAENGTLITAIVDHKLVASVEKYQQK